MIINSLTLEHWVQNPVFPSYPELPVLDAELDSLIFSKALAKHFPSFSTVPGVWEQVRGALPQPWSSVSVQWECRSLP